MPEWWHKYPPSRVLALLEAAERYEAQEASGAAALVHQGTRTLTNAEFKALPTTPQSIIVPPSGLFAIATRVMLHKNFSVAYDTKVAADLDYINVRYGQTEPNDHDFGYIANNASYPGALLNAFLASGENLTFVTAMNMSQSAQADWALVLSRSINISTTFLAEGIWIGGGNDDFTGGNAANVVRVIVEFRVYDTAQRKFLTTSQSGWDETTRTFS